MLKKNYSKFLLIYLIFFMPCAIFCQTNEENVPNEAKPNETKQDEIQHDHHLYDPYLDQDLLEHQENNHLKGEDNFQAKFLNMLFILGLLIGFMILASWLLKRMMKARITQINQASYIRILETRQLSPKSVLYLLEIEDEKVLVGESQSGLHLISTFPTQIEIPSADDLDKN